MTALVITPTLGRSIWLTETCASVASLGAGVRHRLVCPGGVADRLSREYTACEIEVCDESGVYAALNQGLATAGEWDFYTWINDDDLLDARGVKSGLERLRGGRSLGVVYGRVDYCDGSMRNLGPLPVESAPRRLHALFAAGLPAFSQHGTWVRRAVADRLKGFDLRYRLAGDYDYWARALVGGASFEYVPERVGFYRLRAGQLSGDIASLSKELEDSRARHFGHSGPGRGRLRRWAFRLRHAPDVWRRWQLTGCLRTQSLYERAAFAEGP